MKKVLWLIWKDLAIEVRSREVSGAMVLFALMVIVVFAFSFIQPGQKMPSEMIPGVIWVTIIFAGMLGLNRSFLAEKENDALIGLFLAPISKSAIYLGKTATHFLFLSLVELCSLPLIIVFFNVEIQGSLWSLLLILFLGIFGFSGVGVFLGALAANTKSNELLLPIILFPILIPLFLAGVKGTGIVLSGSWADPVWVAAFWSWIRLMVVFDVIFFSVSLVLIEYVLEV
ncbi:MAG: heme exporter protein CcmB [Dehalobacterium sp.]|jgi:heme exporter protein B